MQFECKQCATEFEKGWGQAACPKCGSKDLWTTGGETNAIARVLVVAAVMLILFYLLSPLLFLGGMIGAVVAVPAVIWVVLKRRKPRG